MGFQFPSPRDLQSSLPMAYEMDEMGFAPPGSPGLNPRAVQQPYAPKQYTPTMRAGGRVGTGGVSFGANVGLPGGGNLGIGPGGISVGFDINKLAEALKGFGAGGQRGLRTPTDLMKETYSDPMFRASQENAARGFEAAPLSEATGAGTFAPESAGGLSKANAAAVESWVAQSGATGATAPAVASAAPAAAAAVPAAAAAVPTAAAVPAAAAAVPAAAAAVPAATAAGTAAVGTGTAIAGGTAAAGGASAMSTLGPALLALFSDRKAKENFKQISTEKALSQICNLPVTSWNYKGHPRKHVGPMAQDFKKETGLSEDDKIYMVDIIGTLVAAVQELARKLDANSSTTISSRSHGDGETKST